MGCRPDADLDAKVGMFFEAKLTPPHNLDVNRVRDGRERIFHSVHAACSTALYPLVTGLLVTRTRCLCSAALHPTACALLLYAPLPVLCCSIPCCLYSAAIYSCRVSFGPLEFACVLLRSAWYIYPRPGGSVLLPF